MTVALVGSGPARDAVAAALADVSKPVADVDPGGIGGADLAVVVGTAGDAAFGRANETARAADCPWLAVESGGLGGLPVVEAAVTGFSPTAGCYECLRTRVAANTETDHSRAADPSPETARFAGAVAGREAVRFLTGRDSAVAGGIVEVPYVRRQFLPVPGCSCAADRTRSLAVESVDRTLEESLARAERTVDERVGLVTEVGEFESFPAPYYLATLAGTSGFSDAVAGPQAAGGDGDWNAAFMTGICEGLERYCAGVYRTATFERATPADVTRAVRPAEFVRPDDGWADPGAETAIPWVTGRDLAAGEAVRVPAEFVHFPPPEKRFRPPVTTGLGLGNSTVEALLSGLYEAVERDAAMLAWYSTFEPLGLDISHEGFESLAARAESEGLSVTPLLLTQDVDVPVVAVAVTRELWPRLAFGLSAHLDATHAARDALAEALQNWIELRAMGDADAADADGAIGRYAHSPGDAAAFAAPTDVIPAASVGPATVPTGEPHLEAVVERVTDAGLSAYGARTTTRDVAAVGFEAVRALVPAAQPLFFDDAYFGERAATVPKALGFESRPDRAHHPFP